MQQMLSYVSCTQARWGLTGASSADTLTIITRVDGLTPESIALLLLVIERQVSWVTCCRTGATT